MGKQGKSNGQPASLPEPIRPPVVRLKTVELRGGDRLRMENLLLERDLLEERTKNLELRRQGLDRLAVALNAQIQTNARLRDEFIASRGLNIDRPVAYENGKLSET